MTALFALPSTGGLVMELERLALQAGHLVVRGPRLHVQAQQQAAVRRQLQTGQLVRAGMHLPGRRPG